MSSESFFETAATNLKLNTVIPFDCFIRNEVNGKMVHWLLRGSVFDIDRKTKLDGLVVTRLWVMHMQRPEFLKYIEAHGHIVDREAIVLDIPARKESQFHVFGRKKRRGPKTIIVGLGHSDAEMESRKAELPPPSAPKSTVDAGFINVVIESTIQVFLDQFSVSVTSKAPTRRSGKDGPLQIDIASFIGLTSQTIRGTVGLCFPSDTYFYLLKKVTGIEKVEASPEFCVGSAELMNSIFESARPKLINMGYHIDQAIPAFVVGQKLSVSKIIPDKGFSIVFESPGGPFQFEIGVKTGA